MNNPQRAELLLCITKDKQKSYEIVAESSARDLEILDKFIDEFVDGESLTLRPNKPELIYVRTTYNYSLCIVEEKNIHSDDSILLTLVSGFSPMNWGEDFFAEAEKHYDFMKKSIYMRLYEEREDERVFPVK
ncbi:TPA: hypothetical protein UDO24_000839 [Streptococcus suis]|uniref:hypothetical protein n=1 Tax=Streptococcus suis TaxID=1307 RepID=UPI000CF43A6A|nr:hypothetical protein [Streptococcus suis]MCK4043638.1 hypothetical protein [Streptococcus suis]HEL2735923.1 hypothetical protein [Streptococcus suis]HEM2746528.1 hypothetical protein [Streptococcus suis]HEP1833370.1 hypothetical protein [Streptococcus suis]